VQCEGKQRCLPTCDDASTFHCRGRSWQAGSQAHALGLQIIPGWLATGSQL